MPRDWKRATAWLIFYAFAYAFVFQPMASWLLANLAVWTGVPLVGPPPLAETLLLAGTLQLSAIGGIQVVKDKFAPHKQDEA